MMATITPATIPTMEVGAATEHRIKYIVNKYAVEDFGT